ncbi:hypothetical protein EPN90_00325 [Patescibacteria group bacterium]|nr:MAG: hypothetical protein EPN90_00325 [Patescibacteria group bacterium]
MSDIRDNEINIHHSQFAICDSRFAISALLFAISVLLFATPALATDCSPVGRGITSFKCPETPTHDICGVEPKYSCPDYLSQPTYTGGKIFSCESCGPVCPGGQIDCAGTCKTPAVNNCQAGQSFDPCTGACSGYGYALVGTPTPTVQSGNINISGQYLINGNPIGGGAGQWITNGTSIYYNVGNVGIGVSSPTSHLQVEGDDPDLAKISVKGIGSVSPSLELGQSGNPSNAVNIQYDVTNGAAIFNNLFSPPYFPSYQKSFRFQYKGGDQMVIEKDSNYVGIGTDFPQARLNVEGVTDDNAAKILVKGAAGINPSLKLGSTEGDAEGTEIKYINNVGESVFNNLYTGTPNAFRFQSGGTDRLVIQNSGNIGIGTSNPAIALDVNGGLRVTQPAYFFDNVGIGTLFPFARLSVYGNGGSNVDLTVNGRIQTGDGSGLGGVWVDNTNTKFVGANGDDIGFWNKGWWLNIGPTGVTELEGDVFVKQGKLVCIGGMCRTTWPSSSPSWEVAEFDVPNPTMPYTGLKCPPDKKVAGFTCSAWFPYNIGGDNYIDRYFACPTGLSTDQRTIIIYTPGAYNEYNPGSLHLGYRINCM